MSIIYLIPYLIQEIITLVYFPVWWYTKGALQMFLNLFNMGKAGWQSLALGIWLKNWATPMFGQEDWQGRIISFFIRTVQIFFRTIAMMIWVVLMVCIYVLYISLPIWAMIQLLMTIFK